MLKRSTPCLTVLGALLAAPTPATAQGYVFSRITVGDVVVDPMTGTTSVTPTGLYPSAYAINASNQMAGSYLANAQPDPPEPDRGGLRGWVWTGTVFKRNIFNRARMNLYGLNDAGDLAGEIEVLRMLGPGAVLDGSHGYVEIGGVQTQFDAPAPCYYTVPHSMNNNGQTVGFCHGQGFNRPPVLPGSGFLRARDGTFRPVEAPGATITMPYGINDGGSIVGSFVDGTNAVHAFYYDAAGAAWTTLDVPGASGSEAHGLNNVGQVIGFWWINNPPQAHGFIWDGTGFTNIDYPPPGPGVDVQTRANGINDNGLIVGNVIEVGGEVYAFAATPN